MTCKRVTEKKYRTRPSPPYHAQDCKGLQKKGNDGQIYQSTPDRRGIYRWTQKKGRPVKGEHYIIHDNYNRPFVVYIQESSRRLSVYKANADETPGDLLYETTFTKVFIGDNVLREKGMPAFGSKFSKGNTILAELAKGKYLFVGPEVFTFQTEKGDEIVGFQSPIGPNDFPYPFAVGKKHLYSLILTDYSVLPIDVFDVTKSLTAQYYDAAMKTVPKKPLRVRMIQARII